ncbi:MAG: chemotaxis protein CheB [Polyangiaceae bacterium]
MTIELVVMGASLGGLRALRSVLGVLPASFPIPIAVVQHRSDDGEGRLVALLQDCCSLEVADADDKAPLTPGRVYLAPPDYHLLIGDGMVCVSLDEPVSHSRPSIDVLFETAAHAFRARTVAVVLTGSSRDGVEGARHVHEAGGTVIVQDPDDAASDVLPRAVLEQVPGSVTPLAQIPYRLGRICGIPDDGR